MENLVTRMGEVATLILATRSILQRLQTASISSHTAQNLQDPLSTICQMLVTVEKILEQTKQISDDDSECESLKRWVSEVSKAVYEASDLVDEVVANSAAPSLVSKLRRQSLFGFTNSSSASIFGVTMGAKIKGLCNKLAQLCQPQTNISLLDFDTQHARDDVTLSKKELRTPVYESIVGRYNDKKIIINYLLDTSDPDQHITVGSIIGIGGAGKTTLAQIVFNDEIVKNHFDLMLWIYCGGDFDLNRSLTEIINSCLPTSKIHDLASLECQFCAEIREKLFFVVLDDVWCESPEKWLSLKKLLMVGARGSKILLTTRSMQVASVFDSNFKYPLMGLSDDDSWRLFKEKAFGKLEEEKPTIDLGLCKAVLRRLAGLPLAINVFASNLYSRSLAEWQDSFDQMLTISASGTTMLDLLAVSCKYLPSALKCCFALSSLFPTHCVINISDLVSLWMAHGFIKPNDSTDELEDIAEHYFIDLMNRGFFQDLIRGEHGKLVASKMHDLIEDLAHQVAIGWGTKIHLSIHETNKKLLRRSSMTDDHKLQTFLCWVAPDGGETIGINDIMEMSNFKSLRVLDLHAYSIDVLPDSIGSLIHLRYLDLSHSESLQKLPKSISNLHHLQTLKLDFCYELKELPTCFGKLVHLRRLELDGCEKLTFMPPGFENLSSLRVLSRYMVGRPRFVSASGLKSLGNLNHLRGRLTIELSENWATAVNEAAKSNLINKNKLTELRIKWEPTRHTGEVDETKHQKLLLDGLQPPLGLKGLQIEGYRGNDFPKWARGNELATALPNLITVSIDGCGQCEILPPFSCLPHLERLSLWFMHNVEFFENSDDASASNFFRSLQELTLHSFYSLKGWWKDEAQSRLVSFTRLQKIKIWSCPKLESMPLFPDVEVLDMQNINEKLLIIQNSQKFETSMLPSSSNSEISPSQPTEHSENLQHLKKLHIKGCPRLKTLAFMKNYNDLEELEIVGCEDLDLSGGCNGNCGVCQECCEPWQNLSKLLHLTLRELPKLVTLPVGLRHNKTLKSLCISTCNSFSDLSESVRYLTSLQHLRLEGCPALTMFPEGLKDINSLVKIDIIECPQLAERYQKGVEEHKIKQARVLCHNSWRYALMSDAGISQKPRNPGGNVVVCSEDPSIHVDVTIKRKHDS